MSRDIISELSERLTSRDFDTNFRQSLEERDGGHRWFEPQPVFEPPSSSPLDREYIARSIKLTAAKMTKNFHSNRTSEEHTPATIEMGGGDRDTISIARYLGPQLGRLDPFDLDNEDIQDSIYHGNQIMDELRKEVGQSQGLLD